MIAGGVGFWLSVVGVEEHGAVSRQDEEDAGAIP